jgi:hypothetical protein
LTVTLSISKNSSLSSSSPDFFFQYNDSHNVCAIVLKQYLRDLNSPLLPAHLYDGMVAVGKSVQKSSSSSSSSSAANDDDENDDDADARKAAKAKGDMAVLAELQAIVTAIPEPSKTVTFLVEEVAAQCKVTTHNLESYCCCGYCYYFYIVPLLCFAIR